jgi:hypothetical protein
MLAEEVHRADVVAREQRRRDRHQRLADVRREAELALADRQLGRGLASCACRSPLMRSMERASESTSLAPEVLMRRLSWPWLIGRVVDDLVHGAHRPYPEASTAAAAPRSP